MPNLTLWAVNTVASWDPEPLIEALARPTVFGARNEVAPGNRRPFNRASDQSTPHALSHEDGDPLFNEYFVPIAVKCIGDPDRFRRVFADRLTADGLARLDRILWYYDEYFVTKPEMAPWYGYWNASPDGVVMFTRERGLGFYELVASQPLGVLVGYSQGGLVARYLAWLDEKLMRPDKRSICGVITVQSPLRGSPFANQRNESSVAMGLLGMLTGVAGFPIVPAGSNAEVEAALMALTARRLGTSHFSAQTVADLLDAARKDAAAKNVAVLPQTLAAQMATATGHPKDLGARFRLVVTLRKWLSGLVPIHTFPTAFSDLNPMDLDKPESVLGSLARDPLQHTWVGSIVGTNNRVSQLAADGRPWWQQLALQRLLGSERFQRVLDPAEAAYSGAAMLDSRQDAKERQVGLQRDFLEGLDVETSDGSTRRIDRFAHDFIIPSASQAALPPADPPPRGFLGNLINASGTHLGGSLPEGGESDQKLVVQMLRRIGKEVTVSAFP